MSFDPPLLFTEESLKSSCTLSILSYICPLHHLNSHRIRSHNNPVIGRMHVQTKAFHKVLMGLRNIINIIVSNMNGFIVSHHHRRAKWKGLVTRATTARAPPNSWWRDSRLGLIDWFSSSSLSFSFNFNWNWQHLLMKRLMPRLSWLSKFKISNPKKIQHWLPVSWLCAMDKQNKVCQLSKLSLVGLIDRKAPTFMKMRKEVSVVKVQERITIFFNPWFWLQPVLFNLRHKTPTFTPWSLFKQMKGFQM